MSDQSRRAQKKALTRAHVRETAQRLFADRGFDAVTIADVAAAADVAVQTVFNHFTTKEELYWADRTPWVDGPAAAVRERPAGVPALTALRAHLVASVGHYVERLADPTGRCAVTDLDRSPALQASERELHHTAEARLREALVEAWTGPCPEHPVPADPRTTAAVVAATWLAVSRILVTQPRSPMPAPEQAAEVAAATRALAERLLSGYEAGLVSSATADESARALRAV
ncbi:TetR/AcrR family transcriptional regulator [Geodermatophilus sp. SYSU D00698]